MKRTLMQVYVKDSINAVKLYEKAFDATLGEYFLNENGRYYHSELMIYGQVLSVAEITAKEIVTGNTMQFCLQFDPNEKDLIAKAYQTLAENATVLVPLGPVDYSEYMCDVIDKYGVRWCLFIA